MSTLEMAILMGELDDWKRDALDVREDHEALKAAILARVGGCQCELCAWVRDQAAA